MADIAIFRINYKSDFILTLQSDAGWLTPFCIKFWTGAPSQAYFVGYNGENYVNCRVGETPTQLLVMFDDHHMPVGPLRMQIAYHTTIEEFPDRKFDEVTNPTNVTVDIDGTEYQVMLDFTGETGAEIDFSMPSSGVMSVNGKIGYVTLTAEDVGAQPTIEDLATIRSGAAEGATAVQPAEMTAALATKQDTIPDLANIRSGAAAGATAVQPAALQEGLAMKQDVISDLSTIRNGAAAGATAVQPAGLTPIESALQTIESVIPSAASSQNQLADKNFVNSSISTNTANFVGTYNSLAELQAVQNPTNNDYGFVIETDAQGNEYYDRYKYVAASQQWLFEYKVESTPFTAEQWAAIQSGITSALVTKLNALPTNAELQQTLDGKADTSDIPTALSQLSQDSTHRVVTDAEKSTWNGKQNAIDDLATIRSGAAAGATAVQPAEMTAALATKQDTISDLSEIRRNAALGATAVRPSELQEGLATKQNVISDLATIRSGAAAGATAVQPAALTPIQTALQTIEAVIPSAATSQNQLADKNFVNISISTNTANFVGTYNSLSELQAVQNPTNNDYGFVIETDAQGNEYYDRYKYVAASQQWLFEYKVESTPFTADQWAAIQSGITSALVTKLNALPTNAELQQTLDGKANTSDIPTALSQLSQDSTHRVVTDAEKSTWNGKQNAIDDLATIRSGAAAGATAVQPAAMNTALAAKQDTLTFDNTPTANSSNPVKSSGIKTALDAKQSTISTVNVTVDNNTGTPSGSASVSGSTLSLSFQNLKGATGATGPQGPQGERGLPGESGVTGDVSGFTVIQTIDPSATYGATDIAGAATVQATNQELTELGGDVYEIITKNVTENLTPSIVDSYYLSKTDGTPVSNVSWFYSDEIEIPNGTISWEGFTLNTWYCANIVFYDSNHEFLSMIQASSGSTTMPSGAKYFRFSGEKKNTYSVTWEHAVGINEDVEQLREDVDALSGGVQAPINSLVYGGAVNGTDSGGLYTWIYTEPVDDEYYIKTIKTANSHVSDNGYIVVAERSSNTFTIVQSVPFTFVGTEFDASKLKIKVLAGQYVGIRVAGLTWKSISTPTAVYGSAYHIGTTMTPNMNYAYGISAEMTLVQYGSLDNIILDLSEKADNVRTLEGKKIFLFGDSISSTDYPWYKQYLGKYTGAFVYNQGASGYNAAYQASNAYFARLATVLPDFVVALVGGNDNGAEESVGTFSATSPNGIAGEPVVQETDISVDYNGTYFVQAISHIIRKWYSLYWNFREAAGLSGNETQDERKAILDAMQKPKMVFCTTLPQKRSNASNAFSLPANWERKRQAVIECCEKYRVPMIDLAYEFAIDWNIEPYWTSPTDKVNNKGVYTMDGLHPNEYGFDYISQIVAKRLLMFAE